MYVQREEKKLLIITIIISVIITVNNKPRGCKKGSHTEETSYRPIESTDPSFQLHHHSALLTSIIISILIIINTIINLIIVM